VRHLAKLIVPAGIVTLTDPKYPPMGMREDRDLITSRNKAGEKMFVDWAGATIPVYDRHKPGDPRVYSPS
jgi:hypothetical protein